MGLKDRKRINNRLPGYINGFEIAPRPNGFGFDGSSSFKSFGDAPQAQRIAGLDIKDAKPLPMNTDTKQPSSAAGIGPWFALGEWAGSGVGAGLNSIRRSDALLQDAGTREGAVNGIAYQEIGDINKSQIMKDYDREMGMSFLTNPFKGLTMLFGRKKQKSSVRAAQAQRAAINTANMASASTSYLQQEYAKQYGDDDDQMLYAKNGKDMVHTSEGEYNIVPNSRVEGGEIIYNKEKGTAHVVPGKPNGDNNYASILPSDTVISNKYDLSEDDGAKDAAMALRSLNKQNKYRGPLGKQTDDLIRNQAMAVLDRASEKQKMYREMGLLPKPKYSKFEPGKDEFDNIYKDGVDWVNSLIDGIWNENTNSTKKDTYDPTNPFGVKPLKTPYKPFVLPQSAQSKKGPWYKRRYGNTEDSTDSKDTNKENNPDKKRRIGSNWWIDGLGALTSVGSLIADSLQRVKRSNSYASNPYANNALADLASLRINPYPINRALIDQNRRNIYATNNLGGLSGAQKAYMNVANNLSMLNAIAKSNADIQEKNNAYRSAYDTAAINAGQADRVARMQANQWDLDYYSKAHAAKQQMIQMDLYNALAALQQGYANRYKKYTFDRMMDNYVG